ncbi:hypothetical protein SEA_MADI_57 [Gordonia phage Madi]|nr:hypothetical protein SEA_MADI_57 [Gordonia phage Madi]
MAPTGQAKTFRFGKKVKNGATKEAGIKTYQGPNPPSGSYLCSLKQLTIKENKNGDNMLAFVAEISDTGPRAKYNGFAIFGQQNITDQGAGYVNQLLDAISDGNEQVREDFWEGAVKTKKAEKLDKNNKPVYHVRAIGDDFKVNSPDDLDIQLVITGKKGTYQGNYKLDAQGYGPASIDLDGDDEDEDDIEAGEDEADETDEDDVDTDEDDSEDDDEDDDDDDDEDDADDEDEGDVFDDDEDDDDEDD